MADTNNRLERIRTLSQRLVAAQKPLRLLDAIRWDDSIRTQFFADDCEREPAVDTSYYTRNTLKFEPATQLAVFAAIASDAIDTLGETDAVARWIGAQCEQFGQQIALIAARGTPAFGAISKTLYGSAQQPIPGTNKSTALLALELLPIVRKAMAKNTRKIDQKRLDATAAANALQIRLAPVFGEGAIRLVVSDKLVADAAAGPDYIKLRANASYSERDLGVLEVHEGWVHIGTSLSGQAQPACIFLGKTSPAASSTQEGTAVLTEILAGKSSPARLYKLIQRAVAIHLAEQGASFVDVFRYFTSLGDNAENVFQICMRTFRGSTPTLGPFTKDIGYLRGLVSVTQFVRRCCEQQDQATLASLFCGKCALEDLPLINELMNDGIVSGPAFIPPVFGNLEELARLMEGLVIAPGLRLGAYF